MKNNLLILLNKNCNNSVNTDINVLLQFMHSTIDKLPLFIGYYAKIKGKLYSLNLNNETVLEILDQVKNDFYLLDEEYFSKLKEIDSEQNAVELLKYIEVTEPFIIRVNNKDEEKCIFDQNAFISYILDAYEVVKLDNRLSFYDGQKYVCSEDELRKLISNLQSLSGIKTTTRTNNNIYDQIKNKARYVKSSDEHYISFINGVLEITPNADKRLRRHSRKYLLANSIPHIYKIQINEKNKKIVQDLIMSWANNDLALADNLLEIMAYCLFPNNSPKTIIVLVGRTNGGKSIYIVLLRNFCGDNNLSYVKLHDFGGRFEMSHVDGKMANISDEISSISISSNLASILKDLSSEAIPKIEKKGKDSIYPTKYRCKLIFGCNEVPITKDQALQKRFRIIPFLNTFSPGNGYQDLMSKIYDEQNLEALVNLVIEKYELMLSRLSVNVSPFTPCQSIENYFNEYIHNSDPVKYWIDSEFDKTTIYDLFSYDKNSDEGHTVESLMNLFKNWYHDNYSNDVNMTKIEFMKSVCSNLPNLAFTRYASSSKSSKIDIFYQKNNPLKSRGKNISKTDW